MDLLFGEVGECRRNLPIFVLVNLDLVYESETGFLNRISIFVNTLREKLEGCQRMYKYGCLNLS